METRQGKCIECRVAFRWPYRIGTRVMRLKDAYCLKCGHKLYPTTHLLQWEWFTVSPLFRHEVIKKFGLDRLFNPLRIS